MTSLLKSLRAGLEREAQSLKAPPPPTQDLAPLPRLGQPAPSSAKLNFDNGKPTLVAFLRHCGCPCKSARCCPERSPLLKLPRRHLIALLPHQPSTRRYGAWQYLIPHPRRRKSGSSPLEDNGMSRLSLMRVVSCMHRGASVFPICGI